MKINMKKWVEEQINSTTKKAMPILSFPCAQLLGVKVSELINSASLQARGMIEVAKRVDSGASVSLMDLSVEAECFGSTISVSDDEVPTVVGKIIESEEDAENLVVPSIGSARSKIYIDAIRKASESITDRPVLAGMVGPFSLSARLMDVTEIMIQCYEEPDMVHTTMEKTTEFLIEYAKAYKSAGANGVVIAEPVSGLLSPSLESEFSSPYVKKIVDAVQDDEFIVVYHNCGNNVDKMTESISSIGAMAYHFGNSVDMETMLKAFPDNVLVMGNVDPAGVLRMGNEKTVREKTLAVMEKCKGYKNFIISSGCDIPPLTPWENIDAFFDAVKEFYGK